MARIVAEHLNPRFGYFYTVERSLYTGRTSFQDLEIVETAEFGKVMLLDGVTQVVEKNDWMYHEPMVHPAMTTHPAPKSVCVIGAGDGGIVREVLKHGPDRVVHAELDGVVVEESKRHLPVLSQGCWDDPRVELHIGDGRKYIEEAQEPFDVVIMDMTDPFGPSVMLYTQDYFRAVKKTFRDRNGLFVMHAESPVSRPNTFKQIVRTLGTVFGKVHLFHLYIQMYAVQWCVAVCGDSDDVATIAREEIARRLAARGIRDLEVYGPETHHSMQVAFPWIRRLRDDAASVPVITDADPRVLDEIDINRGAPDIRS